MNVTITDNTLNTVDLEKLEKGSFFIPPKHSHVFPRPNVYQKIKKVVINTMYVIEYNEMFKTPFGLEISLESGPIQVYPVIVTSIEVTYTRKL